MIIAHVCHNYWPIIGGIENVVRHLAEGMAKLGHEVHVITSPYGAKNRPREEEINNVLVHRIKSIRLKYPDLTCPLKYNIGVLKNADIVHGHSQNSLFTIKILKKAKELGTSTAIHIMAVDALNDHPNRLIRFLGPYYSRWLLMKAINTSDIKLTKSHRDEYILRKKYNIDTVYIPDGIPDELLEKPDMSNEFRDKYAISEPFIVYIGRLHESKGINILIKAMSIVVKEEPELKAVIIGPGNQKHYMELSHKLNIKKNIIFTGLVDENTKISALDASIALVLPSTYNYVEVFSLVISEAWARRKPVIASAVGEIPYRVKHMKNGLLIPPKDPQKLANAILLIYQDKKLAKRLSENGYLEVKGITWSNIVDTLIKIYQKAS